MRLWMLKFTYGVEIGAHLAYLGHYGRTKDLNISNIAKEEKQHQEIIKIILREHGTTTNFFINSVFWIVGTIIRYLCYVSPVFLLNRVATALEIFAVYSYKDLSVKFPKNKALLLEMGKTEEEHIKYFRSLS